MNRPSPLAAQFWLVAAALLLVATILMPGIAVVLWFFALSGFIVGGASMLIDLTWQLQTSIFAILGVALVIVWSDLDRARGINGDAGRHVNERRPVALVGRIFRLEKPIVDNVGVLTTGDTAWRISGEDCAAGRRVRVQRVEGTLLIVDPVEC